MTYPKPLTEKQRQRAIEARQRSAQKRAAKQQRSTQTQGQPAAGWYPDPHDPAMERQWDGMTWTSQVRDPNQAPPPAPKTQHLQSSIAESKARNNAVGCATGLVLAVVAGAILIAIIGSSGSSGTDYTRMSLKYSSCDHYLSTIGSQVQPILNINNTSGHAWKQTYLWIDGNDNFRNDGISLNNQRSVSLGGGIYALGPMGRGLGGDVHIYFTADKIGAPQINFSVWGNSKASIPTVPNIPTNGPGLSCSYVIR